MSVLALLLFAFLGALVLVAIEVGCAVARVAWRPSVLLRALAAHLGFLLGQVGELLGRLADVFQAFKHLVLFLRRIFFAWIPVELVKQAMRDLRDSTRDLLSTPAEFVWGIVRGLGKSAVPFVATFTFAVFFVVAVVLWEAIALMWDWRKLRLSVWIMAAVEGIRTAAWALGYALTAAVTDTYNLLARLVSTLLAIPLPMAREAVASLANSTRNITQVPHDIERGVLEALPVFFTAMPTPLVAALQVLGSVILVGAIVAVAVLCCQREGRAVPPVHAHNE